VKKKRFPVEPITAALPRLRFERGPALERA